ncbi:hypothetical protein CPB86DRAFT_609294 [Serendipita vermifera]|nr:hypothetical protein CPB86DRAFT_609294 [Serendipita vermifera]
MKLTSPLPQILPKECAKAAKIFHSFVQGGGQGLDGIIPREVLEKAYGFAFLSVVKVGAQSSGADPIQLILAKAGFLVSARAGSGLVIARLDDDSKHLPNNWRIVL